MWMSPTWTFASPVLPDGQAPSPALGLWVSQKARQGRRRASSGTARRAVTSHVVGLRGETRCPARYSTPTRPSTPRQGPRRDGNRIPASPHGRRTAGHVDHGDRLGLAATNHADDGETTLQAQLQIANTYTGEHSAHRQPGLRWEHQHPPALPGQWSTGDVLGTYKTALEGKGWLVTVASSGGWEDRRRHLHRDPGQHLRRVQWRRLR